MRSIPRFAFTSMVLMLAVLSSIPSASAQSGSQVGPAEEMELKIHELQHTRAAEAATMLQKLFPEEVAGGVKVTADERSNSLAIRAPASVQRFIATFLKNADRPDSKRPPAASSANEGPDASEPASNPSSTPSQIKSSADEKAVAEIKIFKLTNTRASDAAELLQGLFRDDALQTLFPDESSVPARFSVDARTNSVIVIASEPHQKLFEALLLNLDEQVDSKQPKATRSTGAVGGGGSNSLAGMAANLRRNNKSEAIGSPEFQRYEQEAYAAAEVYRQQWAITPKDEGRLAQIKADLQGAVHSAFHARQAWQRSQVAEMRKRLDEIEKNISARSQRDKEIIERRVEDLINPERQWESETGSTSQDAATIGDTQDSQGDKPETAVKGGRDASAVTKPNEGINAPGRDVWTKDYVTAVNSSRYLKRPLLIWFRADWALPCRKMEKEVLQTPGVLNLLSQSFVAVKIDIANPENAKIQKEFEVVNLPTVVVTNHQGSVIVRRQGLADVNQFVTLLQNSLAKQSEADIVWMTDFAAAKTLAEKFNRNLLIRFHKEDSEEKKKLVETAVSSPYVRGLLAKFVLMAVDIDDDGNRELVEKYQRLGDESLQVTRSDGKPLMRFLGDQFVDPWKLEDALREAVNVRSEPISQERALHQESGARDGAALATESGPDPRRSVLEAENAMISAKAAVAEAAVEAEAADGYLPRLLEAQKTGSVAKKVVVDAQNESKRKAAALNRARADLQGKERLLSLAKEHLEAQIKFADLEAKQAKSQFDLAVQREARAKQLAQKQSITSQLYDETLAAREHAWISFERATAKYELYRKALPGQSAPTGDQTPQSQAEPERPAEPAKPDEKRE
ncbi:MAG TPA: secretin N-terminal domain-containing protein [Planctomycetaceae bacterium]